MSSVPSLFITKPSIPAAKCSIRHQTLSVRSAWWLISRGMNTSTCQPHFPASNPNKVLFWGGSDQNLKCIFTLSLESLACICQPTPKTEFDQVDLTTGHTDDASRVNHRGTKGLIRCWQQSMDKYVFRAKLEAERAGCLSWLGPFHHKSQSGWDGNSWKYADGAWLVNKNRFRGAALVHLHAKTQTKSNKHQCPDALWMIYIHPVQKPKQTGHYWSVCFGLFVRKPCKHFKGSHQTLPTGFLCFPTGHDYTKAPPTLPPPFLRASFRAKKMEVNLNRQRDPCVISTKDVPATLLWNMVFSKTWNFTPFCCDG